MIPSMMKRVFKANRPQKQKKQLNNKGVTLVEIIISITILGVVAVPVLRSITSAMYYNAKARTRQNVTLSAESLMETFKGYDLERLQEIFQQAADESDATAKAAAMEEIGVANADDFVYPADMNAPVLTFEVLGMESDAGKTSCDIKIKATRQDVVDVMELDNILTTRDAIFKADRSWDTEARNRALDDFIANHQSDFLTELNTKDDRPRTLTESDVDLSCLTLDKRELTFNVSSDGTNDIVSVNMVYTYHIKEHSYYELTAAPAEVEDDTEVEEADPLAGYEEKYFSYPSSEVDYFTVMVQLGDAPGDYIIYRNPIDIGGEHPLQRLMLYYYPVYDMKDVININNSAGINCDCYMIKQKATELSDVSLDHHEASYQVTVNGSGTSDSNLYHNFDTNLGGFGSSAPGADHITCFDSVSSYAGDSFIKKKALVYKLEMTVLRDGIEVAKFEGTTQEYMDYHP